MFEFDCLNKDCEEVIHFSLKKALEDKGITCPRCGRVYSFSPELQGEFALLEQLIRALRLARPILGRTSVVIDLEGHQVKIPYYLLLTHFASELALDLKGEDMKLRCFISPFFGEEGESELDIDKK